jgi:hypothetical protein
MQKTEDVMLKHLMFAKTLEGVCVGVNCTIGKKSRCQWQTESMPGGRSKEFSSEAAILQVHVSHPDRCHPVNPYFISQRNIRWLTQFPKRIKPESSNDFSETF